ncbi:MAG: thermonuclease family protein [Pyrinomonadaceae bacterium MAG19_C2-C3]|nr:thermonuclease family protein [Pyrinomonadaceae bacterium MAG19_C2-C3]
MMKHSTRVRVITQVAIVLLLVFYAVVSAEAQTITVRGKVVAVADGDTIIILDANKHQHKIRFQGIDAPERSQAFGTRARQHLSDLVFGKDVEVRIDKRDRYGRSVSVVRRDGTDINLAIIQAGFA